MRGATGLSERGSVWEVLGDLLGSQHLILASNRGPMEWHLQEDGQLQPRRGSGGVVTALSGLTSHADFTWIANAMSDGDRRMAEANGGKAVRSPLPGQRVSVRYVNTPEDVNHKHYNIICNPLLWFVQHYLWNAAYTPRIDAAVYDAWKTGYVEVNRQFADAIAGEAAASPMRPLVMVHDYHLYLVPGMVRQRLPEARIQLFIHIPWPSVFYWELLPMTMREAICGSICQGDIVGFQTDRAVQAFLNSCDIFLTDAEVDYNARAVRYRGRETLARAYPISIDVDEVRSIATSSRAAEYEKRLRPLLDKKTIMRVDRTDPSKNILRGFSAYETLLERFPDLRGNVRFLTFLVPSRTHIREYKRYLDEIDQMVGRVNRRFGTGEWEPIRVSYENNYVQAIAAMRHYDVLLVNSVMDGMNLVCKEGPVVNDRNGVLVLSEAVGAHERLKVGALSVASADVEGTTQTLYRALSMPDDERAARNKAMVDVIEREDVTHWLWTQLQDIAALG